MWEDVKGLTAGINRGLPTFKYYLHADVMHLVFVVVAFTLMGFIISLITASS